MEHLLIAPVQRPRLRRLKITPASRLRIRPKRVLTLVVARVLMAEEGTEAAVRTRDIWTSAKAELYPLPIGQISGADQSFA